MSESPAQSEAGETASAAKSATAGAAIFANHSPIDGEALEPIVATEVDQVDALINQAQQAQSAWAARPIEERIDIISDVKQAILRRADEIAQLVHREVGKPVEEAVLAEVLPNADLVDYWCDSIPELLSAEPIELDPLSYPKKRGRIRHDARGVVALITPWNYPVAIPLRTIIPALLAGNAVVFKPSEVTPRCGALIASLFQELLPEGVLTTIQGGVDVGKALVAGAVDLVVFTGSVATGRAIAVACAQRLIPCSLELGGKDAAVVLSDCNLERTVQGVVWGAFTNAGQNCSAVERVYVHKDIADRFIERAVAVTNELQPGVDTAFMTTEEQKSKVRQHLEQAIADGNEKLTEEPVSNDGLAFAPTIVEIAEDGADTVLLKDETFGPVLPIVRVDDEQEAIEKVNASPYALTTSLWTKRIKYAEQLAPQLRSGIVTINNHSFTAALPAAPWTGTGDTGYGITNSRHALHALTRVRFVLADRNSAKRELWWYPYTPALRTIAFAMAKLKGGAGLVGRLKALVALIAAFPKRLFGA